MIDFTEDGPMNETAEFLRECGAFMLLTVNDGKPAGRPFGAVTEIGGALYLSAGKPVFEQLKKNGNVQIVALKAGTRDWIRVDGFAEECFDMTVKAQMLNDCPNLLKHHATAQDETFHAFRVTVESAKLYTVSGMRDLLENE